MELRREINFYIDAVIRVYNQAIIRTAVILNIPFIV